MWTSGKRLLSGGCLSQEGRLCAPLQAAAPGARGSGDTWGQVPWGWEELQSAVAAMGQVGGSLIGCVPQDEETHKPPEGRCKEPVPHSASQRQLETQMCGL